MRQHRQLEVEQGSATDGGDVHVRQERAAAGMYGHRRGHCMGWAAAVSSVREASSPCVLHIMQSNLLHTRCCMRVPVELAELRT
jgi:hypothetical protein